MTHQPQRRSPSIGSMIAIAGCLIAITSVFGFGYAPRAICTACTNASCMGAPTPPGWSCTGTEVCCCCVVGGAWTCTCKSDHECLNSGSNCRGNDHGIPPGGGN